MLSKSLFSAVLLYALAASGISVPRRAMEIDSPLLGSRAQLNQYKFKREDSVKRNQFNPRANGRLFAKRSGPSAECSAIKPCTGTDKICIDGQCVNKCTDGNGVQAPSGGCVANSCKNSSFFYSPKIKLCVDVCVGVGNTQSELGGCLSCRADSILSGTGAQCSLCLGSTIPNLAGTSCINVCAILKVNLLNVIGVQDKVNGGCSSCPAFSLGETYVDQNGQCAYCPLGQTYSSTTKGCKCNNGVTGSSGGCSSCYSGHSLYGSGSTATCVASCPANILSVPGNSLAPGGFCTIAKGNQCGGGLTAPLSYLGSHCAAGLHCDAQFGSLVLKCVQRSG